MTEQAKGLTEERLAEIKKIQACVPFTDGEAGVAETMQAMRELINEVTALRTRLEQAERDRKVLADEVRSWRRHYLKPKHFDPASPLGPTILTASLRGRDDAIRCTDASASLARAGEGEG